MTDAASVGATSSRPLVPAVLFIATVVAVVGSLGAPLITSVATTLNVSLADAQWTLTITLVAGAIATPILGRLGTGPHRRGVVIATLAVVVVGSLLTTLPLSFGWLLVGRAAQGVGLGLTPLMMGIARDHLDRSRASATIALVSVASTVGIGVGYPIAGLLTDVAGIRAAYGAGLVVTVGALTVAVLEIPRSPAGRRAALDLVGGLLLAAGLLALLAISSDTAIWRDRFGVACALGVGAVGVLTAWAAYERRTPEPMVDVALLRHPAVAGANLTMLFGGAGMYLLLTLVTRYVQTPESAGYGFGASTLVAGLVLTPFSLAGLVAGRLLPRLRARFASASLLAIGAGTVAVACVAFAVHRAYFVEPVVAMAVLGLGVGTFSAAMPAVILAVTPDRETSSAMSVNQVVRSIGFSLGSAFGGLALAANTGSDDAFPADSGYTTAAVIGAVLMIVTLALGLTVGRRAMVDSP